MNKYFSLKYYNLLVCTYRMGFVEVEDHVIHYAIGTGISSRMADHDMDYEGER